MEAPVQGDASQDEARRPMNRSSGVAVPEWPRLVAELIALVYIGAIAGIAAATGAFYIMFPELGALSHDVLTRPRGTWANAPVLLAITPVITGAVGVIFTRLMPYGYLSVLLTVGGAITVIQALDSPIAPAISAGLLPLVLNIKSWWYPPGIMLGTVLLAILSIPWKRFVLLRGAAHRVTAEDVVDDVLELAPRGYWWLIPLLGFVTGTVFFVQLTGWRFILFPPLVVIGFEMFGHTAICPWAQRPLWLPAACFLTALGGFLLWKFVGVGPVAAALSMAWGILVLRFFDLHVPPALAVALLPQVIDSPTIAYPLSVGVGTLLVTLWFLGHRYVMGVIAARA
jgi:hypothetical protein